MKPLALLLLFLYFAAPGVTVQADDIRFAPGVTVTAAVTLVADDDGVLQIERSRPILVGSVVGTIPVDPKPKPNPLELKVSALIATAPSGTAEENNRNTVSALYKMTGMLPLTDPAQIRQATTILFNQLPMSVQWKTWKGGVDSFAAGLSAADIKRAWGLLADMLGSSGADGKQIIELLRKFSHDE